MIPAREGSQARQVDVYVEIPTGRRKLRVAIEVRDKSRPLSIEQVEQLCAKLRAIDIDSGCIVSRAGVSKAARAHARAAGIEIRTISEVAMPQWWAAESLHVHEQKIELLFHKVNFRNQAEALSVAPILTDAKLQDVEMIRPGLEPRTLWDLVVDEGKKALDHPSFIHLKDGDEYALRVVLSVPEGTHLRYRGAEIAMPVNFDARYRLHQRDVTVPVSVFGQGESVTAFTGAIPSLEKQVTLVVSEGPNGARTLSATIGDASPPATKVRRRGDELS